jgi:hypothetical protein
MTEARSVEATSRRVRLIHVEKLVLPIWYIGYIGRFWVKICKDGAGSNPELEDYIRRESPTSFFLLLLLLLGTGMGCRRRHET